MPGRRIIPIRERGSGTLKFRWINNLAARLRIANNARRRLLGPGGGPIAWSSCASTGIYSLPESPDTFNVKRRSNKAFTLPTEPVYVPFMAPGQSIEPTHFFGTLSVAGPNGTISVPINLQFGVGYIFFNRPCSEVTHAPRR